MGLEQRGESPLGEPLTDSSPHPVQRGYPGLTTKITRRGLLVSVLAGLAAVGYKETPARADDEGIVVVDGIPVEVSGIQAGGEPPLSPEPAGFKTEDGYAWDDGKRVVIPYPLAPVDFDRLIEGSLKDIQTGQPRDGKAQHTETRTYLDIAKADGLVFVEDPTLAERFMNREQGVYAVTIDNERDPWRNPKAVFMYSEIIIKPTDDPDHPNDIQVRFFKNPNCPTPAPTVDDTPEVYKDFYSTRASNLAQVAFIFPDAAPDTKFQPVGYAANTPQSNLAYNLDRSLPFQIAA